MVDQVAKALCEAAGTPANGEAGSCTHCDRFQDGRLVCPFWETFREEARVAILTAYRWHKKERRWPAFCK